MKLDAHQHFWQFDPVRDAWIDDSMAVLRRDYMPADLLPLLASNHIDGSIAVQADQSETETHFLLDLTDQFPLIKGVVGWIDMQHPDIESRLGYFSQFPALKGFRHIVQGEADVNFMLRPDFLRGMAALERYGFAYDILIYPHQMGAALELVRRFPNQRFVLDHAAKPYIKAGYFDGWAAMIRALGAHENLWCKLSGLTTEADWQHWQLADFLPYADCLLNNFGPSRLMYGSDWPVCLLADSYEQTFQLAESLVAQLSPHEQAQVWGENAAAFYRV